MSWQDRIVIDSEILVGKPVVKGTRLAVDFIIVAEDDRIRMTPLPGA
jgi:uncharacterized protein (DUF433 family)